MSETQTAAPRRPASLAPLARTLRQVKSTLPTKAAAFTDARRRHPALATHESPGATLSALERASPLSVEERDAVVLALLEELRLTGGALWQSLLLAAFEPMLVRLRRRVGRFHDEDLDRDVLLAFLDVARRLHVRSHAARVLRLATEERVFAHRRAESRAAMSLPFDEEIHAGCSSGHEAPGRAVAAEVVRIVEAAGGDELRDVLLATYSGDESLRAHVDRVYAESAPAARASAYDRLCRARLRVVAELRALHERGARAA